MNENTQEWTRVLKMEGRALLSAAERYESDPSTAKTLNSVIDLIHARNHKGGKVIILGVGKSGKVGAKISATLCSTGTPSIFVHPTEALHGDLGVITDHDTVLALSYTGNSDELLSLIPFFERRQLPVIGMGGNAHSKLAKKCLHWIDAFVNEEACAHNLAPTCSTTLMLALGDSLAMALMKKSAFSAEDFAKNHPGGALGRRLQLTTADLMHPLSACPIVDRQTAIVDAMNLSTDKKLGAVLVIDQGKLVGIITDGDLRRALKHREKFFSLTAAEVMTADPITILNTSLAYDALRLMEDRPSQINVLPVTDANHKAVGIIRIHDLVQTL